MSLILSIETSTPVCSVAISTEEELLAFEKLSLEKSHSRLLTVVVRDLLNHSGVKGNEIDAVAVSKGPGSYTGLRIGVSTAKGLCYAWDKPLIAINTLEAMASQVTQWNTAQHWLCPMLDARRMEVYTMLLKPNLGVIRSTEAKILDENSFAETLSTQPVLFFGNGSDKFSKLVVGNKNAAFVNGVDPTAEGVAALAHQAFKTESFEGLAYFEPYYLKDFIATVPKKVF